MLEYLVDVTDMFECDAKLESLALFRSRVHWCSLDVGNLNNAGDEIDVYDRSSLELVTSLEIGNQLFKSGFAFNSTRLFVLSNYPDVEVLVFTIN